jgi:photosynthetic reaction center H subunit
MGTGAITPYVDVAQLVLYAFWIFFAGLIYYLVRENHREGYPMETEDGRSGTTGWPVPQPKTYLLPHGGEVTVPNGWRERRQFAAEPTHAWTGAPLEPTGDPLLAGVGPGAWAERADVPDANEHGAPKIVPLRVAGSEFGVSARDIDPRGLPVIGADGAPAGTVAELWIDTMEMMFRYLEVELAGGGRRVLLPMNFARVRRDGVHVASLMSTQFGGVPAIKSPDQITLLEEEKVMAYYGAGTLYADPRRAEPML